MTPQSIDATIFASEHPNISKRASISGLILSSILVLLGLATLISSNKMEDNGSVLTIVLVFSGAILVIYGIFRLVWKGKEIVYIPTGSITKEQTCFFDLKHLDILKGYITTGKFSLSGDLKGEINGNIRMDAIISQDKKFVAVQLFQFVPYAYNPVTPVYYFTNGEAKAISSFLVKHGCNKH